MSTEKMPREARALLLWYKEHGRELPWRVKGGAHPDAYAVWISEIMLQQTTVQTVLGYFARWMKRFPTLQALAAADLDEVLRQWQGLGYYARARKLYQCAQVVCAQHGGAFPHDREALLALPGIGPYTASSLCAFAFNQPETVVDGNVIRVLARYYGLEGEVDRERIYPLAQKLTPKSAPADYASAIMDLGATVCRPVAPDCPACPWQENCVARKKGLQERIPVLKKLARTRKAGAAFLLTDAKGRFFIRKRGGKGLLAGLWEIPWTEDGTPPFDGKWERLDGEVRHVFTHFDLTLKLYRGQPPYPPAALAGGVFITPSEQTSYAFSTLMRKVLAHVLRRAYGKSPSK